jgi:hypothetical protein
VGLATALRRTGRKGPALLRLGVDHPHRRPPRRPPPDSHTDSHTDSHAGDRAEETDEGCWWLLVRSHRTTGELAFYRCYSSQVVPLRELVRVAGRRWTVEESFQAGKGLAGLDEHQVRRWISWQRWTLLAMIAHALLVVIAANEHTDRPAPTGMIRLTCSEVRRLFTVLITEPGRTSTCPHAWSHWRRRHQHRAQISHYRRQEAARP